MAPKTLWIEAVISKPSGWYKDKKIKGKIKSTTLSSKNILHFNL